MSKYLKYYTIIIILGVIIPEIIIRIYNKFYYSNFIFVLENRLGMFSLLSGILLGAISVILLKNSSRKNLILPLFLFLLSLVILGYEGYLLLVLAVFNNYRGL